MFVVPGIVSLGIAASASTCTFFAARLLAARQLTNGGPSVAIGISHETWVGAPAVRKIAFALSGPLALYALAAVLFTASIAIGGKWTQDPNDMHLLVMPDGPAATAGMRGGDEILSVDEVPIASWPSLTEEIAKHPGEPVRIFVRRHNGQLQTFDVTAVAGKIGVGGQSKIAHVGLGSAIVMGAVEPASVWSRVLRNVGKILGGDANVKAIGPSAFKYGERASIGGALGRVATLVSYHFIILATLLSLFFWPGARWFGAEK